jgi:hypothetical protein
MQLQTNLLLTPLRDARLGETWGSTGARLAPGINATLDPAANAKDRLGTVRRLAPIGFALWQHALDAAMLISAALLLVSISSRTQIQHDRQPFEKQTMSIGLFLFQRSGNQGGAQCLATVNRFRSDRRGFISRALVSCFISTGKRLLVQDDQMILLNEVRPGLCIL